jgi:hypothetical protein
MCKIYKRPAVLTIGLAVIPLPNYAQATSSKMSAPRATAIRTCSALSSYKPPEHISTTIPWYTYATCMTRRRQKL